MIDQVTFAASKEGNKPVLTGILTRIDGNTLIMSATDGYRLSERRTTLSSGTENPLTMIIPARTLQENFAHISAMTMKKY